jgi:hypothetical protein
MLQAQCYALIGLKLGLAVAIEMLDSRRANANSQQPNHQNPARVYGLVLNHA